MILLRTSFAAWWWRAPWGPPATGTRLQLAWLVALLLAAVRNDSCLFLLVLSCALNLNGPFLKKKVRKEEQKRKEPKKSTKE